MTDDVYSFIIALLQIFDKHVFERRGVDLGVNCEVKTKVFKGFKKACHTLYKFDSNTERIFAIVLENDAAVLKWLRPSPKQLNIYYGPGGASKYEPDFVVETANADNSGKAWEYALLAHDEVRLQSSFMYLMKNRVKPEQLRLEMK